MLIVPMLDQGGLERVCALTAQLLKNKYDVHLVVFNTEGMIYDVSGVDLIDLNLGAVPGIAGKLLNVVKRVAKVRKLKKQLGIELSYSFGPTANIVNVLSKYKDFTWAGIRGYGALSDKRSMSFVCKRADMVVGCTRIMTADISNEFKVKDCATLYNPCNIDEIITLSKEELLPEHAAFFEWGGKTVASMGRAHDVKGFWHLIKSVYLAKKEGADLKLMIIGAGDYSEYMQLAKDLGMEDDVLFTGVQKNPFKLLAKADVYALTSDSEGFPNALIEAMAVGLPCISVNCKTGPAEILVEDGDTASLDAQFERLKEAGERCVIYGDYGILLPVMDKERDLNPAHISEEEKVMADVVTELMENPERIGKYQKAAWRRARCFTYENYVKEFLGLSEQA